MDKKPRRLVNPCKVKGRYLGGASHSGQYYKKKDFKKNINGCECKTCFVFIANKDVITSSYQAKFKAGEPESFIKTDFPVPLASEDHFQVVPCEETFRHETSTGTIAYKKSKGLGSKFTGCTDVEMALIDEKLVINAPSHVLGLPMEWSPKAVDIDLSPVDEVLGKLRWGKDDSEVTKRILEPTSETHQTYADFVHNSPRDLKHVQISKLLDIKYFDEGFSKADLEVAEYLELDVKDDTRLQVCLPHLSLKEIRSSRSRIYRAVTLTESWVSRRFAEFLKVLSPKQLEAVQLYYLENPEDHTKTKIAEGLKISISSLSERLDGAADQMRAIYREFSGFYPTKLNLNCAYANDGLFWHKDDKKCRSVVWRVDPKTGKKTLIDLNNQTPAIKKTTEQLTAFNEDKKKSMFGVYFPSLNGVWSADPDGGLKRPGTGPGLRTQFLDHEDHEAEEIEEEEEVDVFA